MHSSFATTSPFFFTTFFRCSLSRPTSALLAPSRRSIINTGRSCFSAQATMASQSPIQTERAHHHQSRTLHEAYLAFGSNLGQRYANIHKALEELASPATAVAEPSVWVLDSSHLYESLPMYYQDQGRFLNGVVKIHTTLTPIDLLRRCKHVEHFLGRRKTINNGPREVDLDILLYDQQVICDTVNDLIVPHQRICEREFVLRPLADLIPQQSLPRFNETPKTLLEALKGPSELTRITPLSAAGLSRPRVVIEDESQHLDKAFSSIHPAENTIFVTQKGKGIEDWRASSKQGKTCRVATTSTSLDFSESSSDWLYIALGQDSFSTRALLQAGSCGMPVLLDVRSSSLQVSTVELFLDATRQAGIKRWQMVLLGASSKQQQQWQTSLGEYPWVFV